MKYNGKTGWNMIILCFWVFFCGKHIVSACSAPWRRVLARWLCCLSLAGMLRVSARIACCGVHAANAVSALLVVLVQLFCLLRVAHRPVSSCVSRAQGLSGVLKTWLPTAIIVLFVLLFKYVF